MVFSPKASGAASGSLVATDDAGTQTALLSGNGQTGPTDTLSVTALTFAAQTIGTTSAAQQVTVSNSGDSPLTNIKLQVTGDFAVTNLCGTSLPGHSTCALQVVYSPKAVGVERGQMTIQDALDAQVVALNGTGTPPSTSSGFSATPSPLTMDFGIQGVHSISSPQMLTVINTGTNALSGISVAASQGFAIAENACTVTIAPGASCTVAVTFAPQVTGTQEGTVQVMASGAERAAQRAIDGRWRRLPAQRAGRIEQHRNGREQRNLSTDSDAGGRIGGAGHLYLHWCAGGQHLLNQPGECDDDGNGRDSDDPGDGNDGGDERALRANAAVEEQLSSRGGAGLLPGAVAQTGMDAIARAVARAAGAGSAVPGADGMRALHQWRSGDGIGRR